jgi:hypothetical protein
VLVLDNLHDEGGWLAGVELEKLDDEPYYLRMRAVGLRVRNWDDRYIGLLVGAVERDLPRKRGFQDVYHMAGVQARMPRKRVNAILAIARTIRCCPQLYRRFTRAEVSWTKVRVIARLVSPERDAELCDLVGRLPRKQLEFWVREQRTGDAKPSHWIAGEPRSEAASAPTAPAVAGSGTVPSPAATLDPSCAVPQNDAGPMARGEMGAVGRGTAGAAGNGPCADDNPGPGDASAAAAPESLALEAPRGAVKTTSGLTAAGASACPHEPVADAVADASACPHEPVADAVGPARRARADVAAAKLVEIGVDPLIVDKLRVDAQTLSASVGRPVALVEALEHAMRDFRPGGPRAKIRTLRVVNTCSCGYSSTPSIYGPLPLDERDAAQLQQSGQMMVLASKEPAPPGETGSIARAPHGCPTGRTDPARPAPGSPAGRGDSTRERTASRARVASRKATRARVASRKATRECVASRKATRERVASPPARSTRSAGDSAADPSTISHARRLSALQQRFVLARQGGRCAVAGCLRLLAEHHHLDAFAMEQRSDPDRIFLICRDHHDAVHAGLIANPDESPDCWRVRRGRAEGEIADDRMGEVNRLVQRHRGKPARRDAALARTLAPEAPLNVDPGQSDDEEPRAEDDQDTTHQKGRGGQ